MTVISEPAVPARGGFDPVGSFDSMKGWKRGIVTVVFLLAVLCILMPELFFLDRIFLAPDTKAPLSFSTVGKTSLEKGTYPLWNPYLFCGMPSYSSLAYTPYVYPVSYLTHLLYSYAGFPEMTWLLLHYLLAGAGVYLLARSFGVRPSVSLIAGAAFMIMPNYIAAGANGHGSQACAVAWMPWALLFARGVMGDGKRLGSAALLAVVLGVQMLRGHIQISYYTFLLIGLSYLFAAAEKARKGEWKETLAGSALLAASFILAIGISAVLVFPVRDYAGLSIRGGSGGGLDYGYATSWSLHPKEMLTFVFPWSSGFGKATYWGRMPFTDYPNYIGACTGVLALIGIFLLKGRDKWFLLTTSVLATLVSFGKFFPPLYDLMFRFLPFFDKFRVPVMILIVQQLTLTLLAALALEGLVKRAESGGLGGWLHPSRMKWVALAFAAALLFSLIGGGAIRSGIETSAQVRARVGGEWIALAASRYYADLVRTLVFGTLAIAAVYFMSSKKVGPSIAIGAAALLVMIDLLWVDQAIVRPENTWGASQYRLINPASAKKDLTNPDETARWLSSQGGYFRIFPVPAARPGTWSHNAFPFSDNSYMMSGIFSMGGYHAAKLINYQNVMDAMFGSFNDGGMPLQVLNMLNARYFVSLFKVFGDTSPFPLVFQRERSFVYENPFVLPRVFFTGACRVMSHEKALEEIVSRRFDPSTETILEKEPSVRPVSADGSSAEITSYELNSITVRAGVEKPCLMVLSEIDYPAWVATVDGEEKEILTANYCLRALPLEPGDHEISFEFRSKVIKRSLILSIASLAFAVLLALTSAMIPGRRG